MANNKTGFLYYNIDTDRYQDIKIKRLKKDFGTSGIAVYDYILCEVYRVKGCFLVWDESTAFDVAEYFGLKENLVNEIVNYCSAVGLFDKALLTGGRIISSRSIQRRFVEMSIRAKRKAFKVPDEIDILSEKPKIIPKECNQKEKGCPEIDKRKENDSLLNEATSGELLSLEIIEVSLKDCFQELVRSEVWMRDTYERAINEGFRDFIMDEMTPNLKRFFYKLKSEGETFKSLADAKKHFSNWLMIELKKQENDKTRRNTFGAAATAAVGNIRAHAEKKTDIQSGGTSQKDYSKRF